MVAIVESSRSIRGPLLYNEQKVQQQKAIFLDAHNYWQDKEDLSIKAKLRRIKDLTTLNERSQAHCIHISINFHPIDHISDKEMDRIATAFMKEIDFKDQPWLAYRHIDAGHPHMHIVTTNIRPDGSRIPNDLRAPYQLEQICQRLEWKHGLAHARTLQKPSEHTPLQKLKYGETSTKEGIANVIRQTIDKYVYTSLDHYNALLGYYHVRADRGSIESVLYKNRGLYFRMIDDQGKKIGAPIKASAFETKPTLDNLEQKFLLNIVPETRAIQRFETNILWTFYKTTITNLAEFRKRLQKAQFDLVIPALTQRPTRNQTIPPLASPASSEIKITDDGHGFFFIDFLRGVVLRDTQISPECTAKAILQRCQLDRTIPTLIQQGQLVPDKLTQKLLQSSDPQQKRNALLRLTPQHDQWEAEQEIQRKTQQQIHAREQTEDQTPEQTQTQRLRLRQ